MVETASSATGFHEFNVVNNFQSDCNMFMKALNTVKNKHFETSVKQQISIHILLLLLLLLLLIIIIIILVAFTTHLRVLASSFLRF